MVYLFRGNEISSIVLLLMGMSSLIMCRLIKSTTRIISKKLRLPNLITSLFCIVKHICYALLIHIKLYTFI